MNPFLFEPQKTTARIYIRSYQDEYGVWWYRQSLWTGDEMFDRYHGKRTDGRIIFTYTTKSIREMRRKLVILTEEG